MANIRPKYAEIGMDLWKIINSPCEPRELIGFIREAIDSKVLTKDEKKLCEGLLEEYEVTSNIDIEPVLKDKDLYYTRLPIDCYKKEEVIYEFEKFMNSRHEMKLRRDAVSGFAKSGDCIFTKRNTSLFLNRYAEIISVKKDTTLDNLLNSFNDNSLDSIVSTACGLVDRCYRGGIRGGTVTTMLGAPTENARSLWSLNMAFNALVQGKNVLFISLGTDERELNKRFILRHSYNLKFESELKSNEEDFDLYDTNLVEDVCMDFHEKLANRLIIFDEHYFDISTVASLQKLFVVAEHKFNEISNHGIDLVIVDDFSNMKLDNGRKMITSKNQIQTEYYSFFRNQSKNLLGTKRMIPIVVIDAIDKKHLSYFVDNDTFGGYMISEVVDSLSDNILVARKENEFQLKVTIVKPIRSSDGAYYLTAVNACFQNWYMCYCNDDETFRERSKKLLGDDSQTSIAVFPTTIDETKKDCNVSTNIDDDDPFGDGSNWATPKQIKQEILKEDNKEENSYEQ